MVGGNHSSSSNSADENESLPSVSSLSSHMIDHGPNGGAATANATTEQEQEPQGEGEDRTYREILSVKALHDGEVPVNLRNTTTSTSSNDAAIEGDADDPEYGHVLLHPDDPPVAVAEPVRWSSTTGSSSAEYDDEYGDAFVVFGPTGEVHVEEVPWAPSHAISNNDAGLEHPPPPPNEAPESPTPKHGQSGRRVLWVSLTVVVAVTTTVLLVTAVAVTLVVRRSVRNDASAAASSATAAPLPLPTAIAPPTMAPSKAGGGGNIPVMYEHLTGVLYGAFQGEEACHEYAISGINFHTNYSKMRDIASQNWLECNATHRFASAEVTTLNYVDGRPSLFLFVDGRWTVQCDYDPVVGNCTADVAGQPDRCGCTVCTTLDGDFGLQIPCLRDDDGACVALSWLANPLVAT